MNEFQNQCVLPSKTKTEREAWIWAYLDDLLGAKDLNPEKILGYYIPYLYPCLNALDAKLKSEKVSSVSDSISLKKRVKRYSNFASVLTPFLSYRGYRFFYLIFSDLIQNGKIERKKRNYRMDQ